MQQSKSTDSLARYVNTAGRARPTRWVAAGLGIVVGYLVWSSTFSNDSLAGRRAALASKSAEQKAAIREQANVFAALPEDERDRIRSVASYVSSKSGAELASAETGMQNFRELLESLPLSDRDRIRGLKDTRERIKAVEEVLKRKEAESADGDDERASRRLRAVPHERFDELARLFESAAGIEPQPERLPLVRLIDIIGSVQDGDRDRTAMLRFIAPIADDILDLVGLDRSTLEREMRERFSADRRFPERGGPSSNAFAQQAAQAFVFATVINSLDKEYQQLKRDLLITDDDLMAAFERRPAEHDRLLSLSSPQFRSELSKYAVFDKIRDSQSTITDDDFQRLLSFSRMIGGAFGRDRGGSWGGPRFMFGDRERFGGGGGGGGGPRREGDEGRPGFRGPRDGGGPDGPPRDRDRGPGRPPFGNR